MARDSGHRDDLVDAPTRLGQVAAGLPEAPDRDHETQAVLRLVVADSPLQRGAQIVVIELQPIRQISTLLAEQSVCHGLDLRQVRECMASCQIIEFWRCRKPLMGVIADRREHGKSRVGIHREIRLDQALVRQRGQSVEDIFPELCLRATDGIGLGQERAARVDRKRSKRRRSGASRRS